MSQPPTPEETRVSKLISSLDVHAPQGLHDRVEALVAEHGSRGRARPTRRLALAGAIAVAAVAALTVAVVGLGGGGAPGSGSLERQASVLALGAPTGGAPAQNPARRAELLASVGGVAFPSWEHDLGWRATGLRTGSVAGRPAATVYYSDWRGRGVGYTIIGGAPITEPSQGSPAWRGGTEYRLVTIGGEPAVVWLRSGRLCVLTGHGVDAATLLRLASWGDRGAVSA
jgi:hypothetical protein